MSSPSVRILSFFFSRDRLGCCASRNTPPEHGKRAPGDDDEEVGGEPSSSSPGHHEDRTSTLKDEPTVPTASTRRASIKPPDPVIQARVEGACKICEADQAVSLGHAMNQDNLQCERWKCGSCGPFSMTEEFWTRWGKETVKGDNARKRIIAMLKAANRRSGGSKEVNLVSAHLDWKPARRKSLLHEL
jgi:hypothetical protein